MRNGSEIMSLNSPGGSTLEWGAVRDLVCVTPVVESVVSVDADSSAVRNDIRQRDDDISADVLDDRSLPRHAQEHQRVHEIASSSSFTQ